MTLHGLPIDDRALADLCRRRQVARLWLFGSIVRDELEPESDVDVLVELQAGARVGLLALAALQEELSTLLGRSVDLVPLEGLKPALRDRVLASRELLYERGVGQ